MSIMYKLLYNKTVQLTRTILYLQDSDDEDEEGVHVDRKIMKRKKKVAPSSRRRSNEDVSESEPENEVRSNKKKSMTGMKTKSDKSEIVAQVEETPVISKEPEFVQIYSGTLQLFDSRNLDPATKYLFRVCAVNSAGASEWSPIAEASTMAAPPAVVTGLQLRLATANALSMIWQRPLSNGENITHFNVDTGSSVVLTPGKNIFLI